MASITLIHDIRSICKDGRSPLKLMVTHKTKTLYIALGVKLTKDEWADLQIELAAKGRIQPGPLAQLVSEQKTLAEARLLELRRTALIDDMEVKELRDRIAAGLKGQEYSPAAKKRSDNFVEHYDRFVSRRTAQGTKDLYNQTLVKIRQFQPDIDRFRFKDITKAWLSDFDVFLAKTSCPNIRNRHFRNIRAVFNDAINEEITTHYPFRAFKMPRLEQTRHRALTADQIRQLRDAPCMDWQEEYRDMFMLSFYLIGINMVDLLTAKKEDVRDGRLEYRRDKTGRLYSIKIEPEAQAIIDKYPGKDWLLSPLDRYRNHKDYIIRMNRGLKKIGLHYETSSPKEGKALFPDISTYWARHSWASIASLLDIPIDTIGRALGHSWVDKTITSIYIQFDTRKVDAANRKVLDYL